jgi:hypothetical protein
MAVDADAEINFPQVAPRSIFAQPSLLTGQSPEGNTDATAAGSAGGRQLKESSSSLPYGYYQPNRALYRVLQGTDTATTITGTFKPFVFNYANGQV